MPCHQLVACAHRCSSRPCCTYLYIHYNSVKPLPRFVNNILKINQVLSPRMQHKINDYFICITNYTSSVAFFIIRKLIYRTFGRPFIIYIYVFVYGCDKVFVFGYRIALGLGRFLAIYERWAFVIVLLLIFKQPCPY